MKEKIEIQSNEEEEDEGECNLRKFNELKSTIEKTGIVGSVDPYTKNNNILHHFCTLHDPKIELISFLKGYESELINQFNKKKFTPLHLLCSNPHNNLPSLLYLFESKADLNLKGGKGKLTPLFLSCINKKINFEIIKFLVENDCDIETIGGKT